MVHYPTLRARLWAWLPARCACGARRFDRCPDAVADALNGHLAPRGGGGYDRSVPTLDRIARGLAPRPAPGRNDRGWYSA